MSLPWRSFDRALAAALMIAGLATLAPGTPAARPSGPRTRVVPPVPGRVLHGRRVSALGKTAVVNFGDLAQEQAQSGHPKPPVRALVLEEEELEEPEEPSTTPSLEGPQGPSSSFTASPLPSSSFMGLNDIPMVDSSYIVIPPDVGGAVGRTRLMSGHNNNYRIFEKSDGSVVSTLGTATFWAPSGETALNGLTDPRTHYDPYNDRWIAVMQTVTSGGGNILVGVSQTGDPNGNWFLYRFATGFTVDFPIVGFNKNWIVVTINRYSIAGAFQRGITLVVNYPLARTGTGSGTIFTQAMNTHFSSAPCATYSATEDTVFVVTHLSSAGATYSLDKITGTPAAPVYTVGGTLTRPGGGWAQPGGNLLPQSAPNSGSSACGSTPCAMECQDSQIRSSPVYRGGAIYYAQTIGLPSSGITHTGVQWTSLNATSGAFLDGGRIEEPTATSTNGGKWYAYPHIAVNSTGDFMVGYSQFSSAQHPAAGYSMHIAGDPAGTIRDPVVYKPGEDYYHKTFSTTTGRNRWGDFSQAQVDPSDDLSLWTVQEYGKARTGTDDGNTGSNSSKWSTYWANVAGPPPTVTIAPVAGQNEGNSGLTPFVFSVNLSTGYSLPVTVNYQTSDGTATAATNDYQTALGSVTIPAGLTSGSVPVNVVGDTNAESDETFTLSLTSATNAVVGSQNASTATILNDDSHAILATAGPNGSITPVGSIIVPQGADQSFTIAPSACFHIEDVAVDGSSVGPVPAYTFSNVTANHTISATFAPTTYTITASAGVGGAISPAGATGVACGVQQTFTITADTCYAIADVVVDGGSLGPVTSHSFSDIAADHTISASFAAVGSVSVGEVIAIEGNGGTTAFDFPVTLSSPCEAIVAVGWQTADSTASASSGDYVANVNTVEFAPGATTGIITVQVDGDLTPEDTETFLVQLVSPTRADIGRGRGIGTIVNDDAVTSVEDATVRRLGFAVEGANPSGDAVSFRMELPAQSRVEVSIYDVAGRRVAQPVHGIVSPGIHWVPWNAHATGAGAGSGVYFVRFTAEGRSFTRKFVLLK